MRRPFAFLPFVPVLAIACGGGSSPSEAPPPTDAATEVATSDAGGDAPETIPDAPDPAAFAAFVADTKKAIEGAGVAGAAIGVVVDGKLAFSSGIGVRARGGTDPVTTSTLFRLSSMTKMITAATAMTLVDDGKVSLDEPVPTYLGGAFQLRAPFDPKTITLRHLLTHTSGVPDQRNQTCSETLSQWFETHVDLPLWSPPGAVNDYTNLGYDLIGLAIEKVDGRPFGESVRARVFDKLGMTATLDPAVAQAKEHAVGDQGGLPIEPSMHPCGLRFPDAGAFASIVDEGRFVEMLLAGGKPVMSEARAADMQSPHGATHYLDGEQQGYGLFVQPRGLSTGETIVSHDGQSHGFRSVIVMVPATKFAVIVLLNGQTLDPYAVAASGFDRMLGAKLANLESTTPAATWAAYAGTYKDAFNLGDVVVAVAGDKLHVTYPGNGSTLLPYDGTATQFSTEGFRLDAAPHTSITFQPEAGAPTWFVTRDGVGRR